MIRFALLITILINSIVNAQNIPEYKIIDSETKVGIKNVNIVFIKNNQIIHVTFSDSLGNFRVNEDFKYESVQISHVLYNSLKTTLIRQNQTFKMVKKNYPRLICNKLFHFDLEEMKQMIKNEEIKKREIDSLKQYNSSMIERISNDTAFRNGDTIIIIESYPDIPFLFGFLSRNFYTGLKSGKITPFGYLNVFFTVTSDGKVKVSSFDKQVDPYLQNLIIITLDSIDFALPATQRGEKITMDNCYLQFKY